VGIKIELAVTPEEALAIGRDLAYIRAEKGRKIIQPLTCRFLVKVFKGVEKSSRESYGAGKKMLHTLNETGFKP
jgi:hypothetical protein